MSQYEYGERTPSPTPEEIQQAAEVLSRLEAGRLDYRLFHEIARLATLASVELVPLRGADESNVEVLLTQRPEGDTWEGQWHVPGTIILPTDPLAHPHDYEAPLARLIGPDSELKSGVKAVGEPVNIDTERRKTKRGDELAVIHYVEVDGEPEDGRFFSAHQFPEYVPIPGVIDHHVGFVQRAVSAYLRDKRASRSRQRGMS